MDRLHGSVPGPVDRSQALEYTRRATELVHDGSLIKLLGAKDRREVPRAREVFVNRNLRMANIALVGFDMDYTLAIYHQRRMEELSFALTVDKLIADYGYPESIRTIVYDHQFVMRGLFVDKRHGNLIKIDRFGTVGRAFHGRHKLADDELQKLYRNERIRLKNPEYAWIDTLFALPEACLYADMIELLEARGGQRLDYAKLYDDIRASIDLAHRDGSLKTIIRQDIGKYVFKDPELGPALHRLRSGGKKLFLLTNSLWDYTDALMKYLLDGVVAEYPTWRNYFDFVVTGAGKPGFFHEGRPFWELDTTQDPFVPVGEAQNLERGKAYQGGNLAAFERLTGHTGETVLYVGDHIYGDILKSKKTSMWRTCMVVQELEDEIEYTDSRPDEIERLSEVEMLRAKLDDEVASFKSGLNALDRRLERGLVEDAERGLLEDERKRMKATLDRLRRAAKDCTEIADALETDVERGFNPYWGLMFKEANENSRFGEQVEQYACVYTSRVSNFVFYSPMQYFRSPRDLMAHERAGALSGKLSPLGSEGGLPKGTNRAE